MYDIAIIGLGPAGSTLARLLPKFMPSLKIIAVDKKPQNPGSFKPEGFHKPCGGLLAPDAQRFLSRFDLALPKSVLADPQIFSVRTIDVKSGLIRHYPRFYINMNRRAFDLWLMSLISDNVEVIGNARCTDLKRESGNWRVTVAAKRQKREIKARYIVGADGANSFVRRCVKPDFKIRSYIAVQQGFENFADSDKAPFYSSVFDPDATDCYAWGLPKDGVFVFGGAFPRKDAKLRFNALKGKMRPFGLSLDKPIFTEACAVNRPASPLQFLPVCGDNAFFVGEAAGFISPSSLEGISWAMNSAYLLAKALRTAQPARRYRRTARKIKFGLTLKLLKCPFMYQPLLRRIVMKSGIGAINNE